MNETLAKISDPSCSFEDIIADPFIINLYCHPNKENARNYFKNHSIKLLNYSFTKRNSTIGNNSFKIITFGDPDILYPILLSDQFLDMALEIVNNDNLEPYIFGRLSTIMLNSLLLLPELAQQSFGFIFHFLSHCDNPSVLHFFTTIVSDQDYSSTHKWLRDMGFIDYLLRELRSINYNYVSNEVNSYFGSVYEKYHSLCKILCNCALNPIFSTDMNCRNLIDVISKSFINPPVYVQNARWRLINQLTTKNASYLMLSLVRFAINVIESDADRLHEYVVLAIEMITKMMSFSHKAVKLVFESKTLLIIMNYVDHFKNSTILLNAFLNFVEASLKFPDLFAPNLATILLPFIMKYAETRENIVMTPFCIKILEMLVNMGKKNRKISHVLDVEVGCRKFIREGYEKYKKIINSEYGNSDENK